MTGENVIQTKSGITITVGVRKKVQKSIIFAKNIIFGIQQHGKYLGGIIYDSVINSG